MYIYRNWHIRDDMMGAIERYIYRGIPPGDFLTAVICNDLKEAVGRADDENLANIPAFVAYFYNFTPLDSWGSPAKFEAWLAKAAA